MVLNFGRPEVNSVETALVALVVGPQSAKSDSTTHVLRAAGAVMLFKHLKHGWVVDIVHRHVVQNEGHLFEWQVVSGLVMAVVNVDLDSSIDVFLVVCKVQGVTANVGVVFGFDS